MPVKFLRGADQASYTGVKGSASQVAGVTCTAFFGGGSGIPTRNRLLAAMKQPVSVPSAVEMMVRTKSVQESDGHP